MIFPWKKTSWDEASYPTQHRPAGTKPVSITTHPQWPNNKCLLFWGASVNPTWICSRNPHKERHHNNNDNNNNYFYYCYYYYCYFFIFWSSGFLIGNLPQIYRTDRQTANPRLYSWFPQPKKTMFRELSHTCTMFFICFQCFSPCD